MPRANLKRMRTVQASGVLALVIALAACTPIAPEPTPTPTPTPSATEVKPTPKPTPSISVAPLAIPDCETLVPLAAAKEAFTESTVYLGELPAGEFVGRQTVPSIPVVLPTASPTRACWWGIPGSDGLFRVVVAGITDAEVSTLQSELAAAGYAETSMGTVTAFELAGEDAIGSLGTTHLFSGGVWILSDGVSLAQSGAIAGTVLESVRTANPALGL